MSSAVTAYTVDLEAIGRLLGSADAVEAGGILDSAAEACDAQDRRSNARPGTTSTALHEILTSRPERLFARHGYALEAWIEIEGHAHPNDGWWSMGTAWFETVNEALRRAGHAGLPHLPLESGLPFSFPLWDEWPLVTSLSRSKCAAFRDSLDAALAAPGWDPSCAEAVRMLRRWVADAALWHRDLVAFYA